MILAHDNDLISRNPHLPGLRLLFNQEFLQQKLQEYFPQLRLGLPQGYYLRYKPNTNCLLSYQLPVNDQLITIYGKTFHREDRQKLFKWQNKKNTYH